MKAESTDDNKASKQLTGIISVVAINAKGLKMNRR